MMQNTLENVQANFVVLAGFKKLCFFLFFCLHLEKQCQQS